MKILHMADLHLDSKMETHLTREQARMRKNELLLTFRKSIDFAEREGAEAVLIAGDIFDSRSVSRSAVATVRDIIAGHPDIIFLCLKGNHDFGDILDKIAEQADNLILFGEGWSSLALSGGRVVVTATDNEKNVDYSALKLDESKINIVMLHGQLIEANTDGNPINIPLKQLKNKSIDYLALGHVHAYTSGRLDGRGIYVYPGCMESRGFDEEGIHGIVLLDIDESGQITHRLHQIEGRSCISVEIDVSDCLTSYDAELAAHVLHSIDSRNMVEAVLTGEVDSDTEIDIDYLQKAFEGSFYLLKWTDRTSVRIEAEKYKNERSLRGEFVRQVLISNELSEEEKKSVINMGIKALRGEDLAYENYRT